MSFPRFLPVECAEQAALEKEPRASEAQAEAGVGLGPGRGLQVLPIVCFVRESGTGKHLSMPPVLNLGRGVRWCRALLESFFVVVGNVACLGAKSSSFDVMPDTYVTFYFLR